MKTNIKKLKKTLKECKLALQEKKLKESSFKDLIQPFIDLLDQIHKAKNNGELDLPPIENDKINIKNVLDTKEDDLSVDGVLKESFYKKHNIILKEEGKTYQDLVNEYKSQGGIEDYNAWKSWLLNQNETDRAKGEVLSKYNFNARYNRSSGVSSNISIEPIRNPDYKPSAELQNLIDVIDAGADFTETALTTVTDKYETIELLLRRVVRGKSTKRYYLLAGDPGIGKTYIVDKILKEEGKNNVPICTGSIGRSPTSIAAFLWKYKDEDLVVLDDCDSFLRKNGNPDVTNILKGCMEAGTGYKVGIPSTIAARVSKLLSENQSKNINNKIKALFEDEYEEEDDEEEAFDSEDIDLENNNTTTETTPTSWTFNSKLIILSNLHESQIEEAIWSRCDHFDLHLTQDEYLIRLAMIIDDMDIGQRSGIFTEEEAKEAKALTLSVMKSVIEAGNNGVKLFGKYIRLTSHLEFRVVKDLCNMWFAMLDKELDTNPTESKDEAKKKILKKWVRIGVIPRLSVTTKL